MTTTEILFLLLSVAAVSAIRDVRYRYFDEYLSSLGDKKQAMIIDEPEEDLGSGAEEIRTDNCEFPADTTPFSTGLTKGKDVTCCALGQLAGDKGYHCYVKFYAARVMLRNRNRAHNRKMAFHGHFSMLNYGAKIMRTFEQCVASRSHAFHKCCQLAATKRKSLPHFDSMQRRKFEQKTKRVTPNKQ